MSSQAGRAQERRRWSIGSNSADTGRRSNPQHYIDLQRIGGRSVSEIRSRQLEFQRAVLAMQLEQERAPDPDEVMFLDRALLSISRT